jgi:hypothetical protein
MGWKNDFKEFVLGDSVLKEVSGSVVEEKATLGRSTGKSGELYGTSGSLKDWRDATVLLEKANLPAHMFALGVGFSAPLYAFTGLKGLTISLYGPTGGGKTLAQYMIQSIYGDPDRLHFAAKYTQNTLFSRLGVYNNLPMTIDEATMLQDKEIGDFLYWVSQGRDKARLTRSAEERDQKTWATPVVVSTNRSLASKLTSSGLDSEAQMARLLEVSVPVSKLFSTDSTAGQLLYNHLMQNYGHAGRTLLDFLVGEGPDGVRAWIERGRKKFAAKYGAKFSGEERYWEQAIFLADLALHKAKELDLIAFDPELGTRWVLEQLGTVRKAAVESKRTSYDLLGEFLNEHISNSVTVVQTGTGKPVADPLRMPRDEVRARIHVWRKDAQTEFTRGSIMIDRSYFKRWLSSKGADFRAFSNEITLEGADATPKSGRAYLTKDTAIRLPQTYVIGFDLAHPKLEGLLNEADKHFNPENISKLHVVSQ